MTPQPPNVVGNTDDAVPFDLARCEFAYGGARFKVVFAPSAEIRNLQETLPPSEWMELVYANLYGRGLFQVQIRPEPLPLDPGGEVPLDGQPQHPA